MSRRLFRKREKRKKSSSPIEQECDCRITGDHHIVDVYLGEMVMDMRGCMPFDRMIESVELRDRTTSVLKWHIRIRKYDKSMTRPVRSEKLQITSQNNKRNAKKDRVKIRKFNTAQTVHEQVCHIFPQCHFEMFEYRK